MLPLLLVVMLWLVLLSNFVKGTLVRSSFRCVLTLTERESLTVDF